VRSQAPSESTYVDPNIRELARRADEIAEAERAKFEARQQKSTALHQEVRKSRSRGAAPWTSTEGHSLDSRAADMDEDEELMSAAQGSPQ